MDNWTEWKTYWWDVTAASFNLAVDIWPIPTVIWGVVIVAITSLVFRKLGRLDEAKNIAIAFAVSLAVTIVTFVLFVLVIGPFLHSKGLAPALTELETLRTEKRNLATTIEDLKTQRDDTIREKKLSEEAKDILQAELDKARQRLDDRKASVAEKVRRKAVSDKLGRLLEEGEALKAQSLTQVQKPAPVAEADKWRDRTAEYVKK
jgi:low affinity Fe/Cu permease